MPNSANNIFDITDSLLEAIKNNSLIEAESDDVVLFPTVDRAWISKDPCTVKIHTTDGKRYAITIAEVDL